MRDVEAAVLKALRTAGIAPGSTVVAAVSGGPDSTALYRALLAARDPLGLRVVACCVDHGIRGRDQIDQDIHFVRGLCGSRGIDLILKTVPAGECAARAQAGHRGLEETARELRHALLREAAQEAGAAVVALGHTQDDVIETLLMRVLQGSDVHGLRGIPARRGIFLRPLLACAREEVISYLAAIEQDWREDQSNQDTGILRNRIRHMLLPVLRRDFPGYRTGLLTLSRKLSLTGDLVREAGSRMPWKTTTVGFSIESGAFLAAAPAARCWSLMRLYDRFNPSNAPRRLPWRFLGPVMRMTEVQEGARILQGHGACLRERAGRLVWEPDIASRGKKGYFIEVSEACSVEIREAGIHLSLLRDPEIRSEGRGGVVLLSGRVEPPVVLRSKRKGDFIHLAGGATSVKDLLIGMKVPEAERDRIPILADRSGVLAVLGGALGYRTRARADILAGDPAGAGRMVVHVDTDMEEGREQQQR